MDSTILREYCLRMNIKQRRKRLGIRRQQFATEVGISTSTLWRIEEKKVNPSPLVAEAIERVLTEKEDERRTA